MRYQSQRRGRGMPTTPQILANQGIQYTQCQCTMKEFIRITVFNLDKDQSLSKGFKVKTNGKGSANTISRSLQCQRRMYTALVTIQMKIR